MTLTQPYEVNENNGKAKYDGKKKILTLNLPVIPKKYTQDDYVDMDKKIVREEKVPEVAPEIVAQVPLDSYIPPMGYLEKDQSTEEPEAPVQQNQNLDEQCGLNEPKKEDLEKPTELVSENLISDDLMKTEVPLESDSQVQDQVSTEKKNEVLEVPENTIKIKRDGQENLNEDAPQIEEITDNQGETQQNIEPVNTETTIYAEKQVDQGFIEHTLQSFGAKKVFMINYKDYDQNLIETYQNKENYILKYNSIQSRFFLWLRADTQSSNVFEDVRTQFNWDLKLIKNYICQTLSLKEDLKLNFNSESDTSLIEVIDAVKDQDKVSECLEMIQNIIDEAKNQEVPILETKEVPQEVVKTKQVDMRSTAERLMAQDEDADAENSDEEPQEETKSLNDDNQDTEVIAEKRASTPFDPEEEAKKAETANQKERFPCNYMNFSVMQHVLGLD